MLSDNIKNYRKESNMSQDDLAEKLGVSRQSISLWETGQTQPTIDNIIALAKIFNISSDMLLGSSDIVNISQDKEPKNQKPENQKTKDKRKTGLTLTIIIAVAVIIGAVILVVSLMSNHLKKPDSDNATANNTVIQSENSYINSASNETASENVNTNTSKVPNSGNTNNNSNNGK